jgi:competence protein ComEC
MLLCLWVFGLCVGLLSGLSVAQDAISSVWWVLGALGGVGLCAWFYRRRQRVLAGFVACFLAGVGLGHRAVRPAPLPAALTTAWESGRVSDVQGVWLRTLKFGTLKGSQAPRDGTRRAEPDGSPRDGFADGETLARGLVAVEVIDGLRVPCQLALTVPSDRVPARPGDVVRFRVRPSLPFGLANPGMPDATLRARAAGIDLVARLPASEPLTTVTRGAWWGPRRLADAAHRRLGRAIEAAVPPARSPLLKALVLGERTAAGPEVEAGFKAAGAVHALSVSGLHLSAVAGALFLLLRHLLASIPALARRVRPPVVAAAASIPALLFYCAITGEATATRRAALMAILGFAAIALGRTPALPAAFAASASCLLAGEPLLLLDPSFQLSFASVAAVALAGRNFAPVLLERWWRRAGVWLGRALWISTAAFLATAPLAAHHFAELAPASPLGNLLLVPPVELGIVPLGLLGAVLGALWWPLGYLPLQLADAICRLALWLASGFRRWAPVWPVPSPDAFEATALVLAAGLVLLICGGTWRDRRILMAAGLAAVIGAGHFGVRAVRRRLQDGVVVTFLDVGQGDAALVEGPRGFVALIDGGGSIDGAFDPGARVIEPVLRRKIIGRIDVVVLSHPHPDHMNGLFRVLERFEVDSFWSAEDGAGNPEYDRLLALARGRGVEVGPARRLERDGLVIDPLGPYVADQIRAPPGLEANDASLVIGLQFGQRRLLFTGDIEAQGEAELLGRHEAAALRSDVLKVPHHGSRTSSSADLVAAVAPQWAVMSLGRRNRFGFPRPEVVQRFRQHGVDVLRTDWNGAIMFEVTGDGVLLATCARSCR